MTTCDLCDTDGGTVVWRDHAHRVVLIDDPDYPGFARVIWQAHVREMTDLAPAARQQLMTTVFTVESALREVLAPDKINLASFGNLTPHLHWHVIPRYADDAHFPQPTWAVRRRDPDPARLAARRALLPALAQRIRAALDR